MIPMSIDYTVKLANTKPISVGFGLQVKIEKIARNPFFGADPGDGTGSQIW